MLENHGISVLFLNQQNESCLISDNVCSNVPQNGNKSLANPNKQNIQINNTPKSGKNSSKKTEYQKSLSFTRQSKSQPKSSSQTSVRINPFYLKQIINSSNQQQTTNDHSSVSINTQSKCQLAIDRQQFSSIQQNYRFSETDQMENQNDLNFNFINETINF